MRAVEIRGWYREASTLSPGEGLWAEKRAMKGQTDEEIRRGWVHGNLETGWI